MKRSHIVVVLAAATIVAAGLGVGLALARTPSTSIPSTSVSAPGSMYSYYRTMMGNYSGSSMMGGSYSGGWTNDGNGYGWMMGGTAAPGWMHGGTLPGSMMGTDTDPGKVMGALWANAPGPRVSPRDATRLGAAVPSGAGVDHSANRITFSTQDVRLVALASPSGGPDETFRIAGLVNPTIVVPIGAHVSIGVVNADPDTAHGLAVTTVGGSSSWMPMMTSTLAFPGSAVWFLGKPTSAGMHAGTLTFTATTAGTYEYLCAVPGHAQKGMVGSFVVTPA